MTPAELTALKLKWFKKGILAMSNQSLTRCDLNSPQGIEICFNYWKTLELTNGGTMGPLEKEEL
jgi:hypothetical protein